MSRSNKKHPHASHSVRAAAVGCFLVLISFGAFFVSLKVAEAQTVIEGTTAISEEIELTDTDPRRLAVRIIQIFLGFLSLVLLALIIWGGYQWMTAAGNEDKIESAKRTLTNAGIGLVIILLSLSISQYLLQRFLREGIVSGNEGFIPGGADPFPSRAQGLGMNVLDFHIPERDAVGVARNTPIILQFKEPIRIESLANGEQVNERAIVVRSDEEGVEPVVLMGEFVNEEGTLFVFRPTALLGSADHDVVYTAHLTDAILLRDGTPAFERAGYSWNFTTSTREDTTPPHVVSIIPRADSVQPRNTIVSVTFSEPILPAPILTAGGLTVSHEGNVLDGRIQFGNGLQVAEFRTNDSCGRNSCGDEVFCLPKNAAVLIRARAATPAQAGVAAARAPFDGIVDLYGNALDGDRDGVSEGSPDDDVTSRFSTNDTIDLVPPVILGTTPRKDAADVDVTVGVEAQFSKLLAASTINTETFSLIPPPPSGFRVAAVNGERDGRAILDTYSPHLLPETAYTAQATSGIRDLFQNCYMGAGP